MGIILSIDCGTTSTRVIAFDEALRIQHIEQRDLPMHHPQPDWAEQNPDDLWELTKACLDACIAVIGIKHIDAMGITNQRESSLVWQKDTGQSLGMAINWQCRRTAKRLIDLQPHAKRIQAKTGLPLDPYFSASKFEWHLNHTPHAKEALTSNNLCFGTIDTWLLWNLTEHQSYATDVTNASRTLLYNIHTLQYDADLCQLFNIPIHALPHVYPSQHPFGHYSHPKKKIPIVSILGDQQAALYAQCSNSTGTIKATYGTGLFVMTNTGDSIIESNDLLTTIAIGTPDSVSYALEGSVFTGGSLLQWLRDQLHLLPSVQASELLATSVSDNGGVCIIPALSGLGAPHWQPHAKGMILGLTHQSSAQHIVRAALESIALQTHDIIQLIQDTCAHIAFNTLKVDGGASQNNWLMQLQANLTSLHIIRPPCIEATAQGVALCALRYLYKTSPNNSQQGDSFTPQEYPAPLVRQWQAALTKHL